ncbi:hypothetical protein AALC17_19300 [Oscillospiraceae bacterium 38-13]
MKRMFAAALLAVLLTACGGEEAAMYIQPAELSEEEEAVAELLGADKEQHLYDVVLDGSEKKVRTSVYKLEDGEWLPIIGGGDGGISLDAEDTRGRMAFGFQDLSGNFREAVQFGTHFSAVSYQSPEEETGGGRGISFLSERREIAYGEEIPLAVQVCGPGDMVLYDVEYFFQPERYAELGYEEVYALTVLFVPAV